MGQGEGPEFWCGTQDVDEAPAVAGRHFGSIRDPDKI